MIADDTMLSDMWLAVAAPNAAEFACAGGERHKRLTRERDDVAIDSRAIARVRRETEMRAEKRIRHAGVVRVKRFPPDVTASSAVYERCGEVGYRSERSRTIARASHWSRVLAISGASGQDVQLDLPVTAQNMSARLSDEATALRIDRAIPRRV